MPHDEQAEQLSVCLPLGVCVSVCLPLGVSVSVCVSAFALFI